MEHEAKGMSGKAKKKVGLIGCGAIGTVLAGAIERKLVACDELVVYDVDNSKAQKFKGAIKFPVTIVKSVDELLAARPEGCCGGCVAAGCSGVCAEDCFFRRTGHRVEYGCAAWVGC